MKATTRNDPVLRFFKSAVVYALGIRLREVLLFGSRARGDAAATADYDFLVVVDKIDPALVQTLDEIAGRALLDLGAVISSFPITEEDRMNRRYSPLLINAAREGLVL